MTVREMLDTCTACSGCVVTESGSEWAVVACSEHIALVYAAASLPASYQIPLTRAAQVRVRLQHEMCARFVNSIPGVRW